MKIASVQFGDRIEVSFKIADPDFVDVPQEIHMMLRADEKFQKAWENLTPGKKRGFCHKVATAKMDETKERRVEQIVKLVKASI